MREGEYFLQLESKEEQISSSDPMDLLSPKHKLSTYEHKIIPVLDIKSIESVDSLTFSIILHDECLLNNYNEQAQEKQNITNKAKNRAS